MGRHYCGSTGNLQERIRQHNDPGYHGSKTTKRFDGPWLLVWSETHQSRGDAMRRERQIKKRGINRFLDGLPDR